MKRIVLIICVSGLVPAIFLFAQSEAVVPSVALKLDIPFFFLPYQTDAAAKIPEYSFFDSYTHPDMDMTLNITADVYSALHYGMKRFKDVAGTDKYWKRFVYYGGVTAGDLFLFFMPPGYVWMHESFHVAGFTHAGLRSHMNFDNLPAAAYAVADSGEFTYWYDVPRTMAAGIESEYLLVEKLQKNNFFYEQNIPNEFLYWFANLQAWSYAYMPFSNENMTLMVEGEKQEVSTDSLQWVYALFHPYMIIPDEQVIRLADLKNNEKEYFKNRVMWSLVNFISPMMLGIRSISIGRDTGIYGNFAFRQHYTSFGTDLSVDIYLKKSPYNLTFKLHNYFNYEHYFPAIEAELVDFLFSFAGLNMYFSPRVLIGMQPKDQVFMTAAPEFFGLIGCRVDFGISKHFFPYIDLSVKTDGWVAGNEYLESNVSFKAGLSMRF